MAELYNRNKNNKLLKYLSLCGRQDTHKKKENTFWIL